MAKSTAFTDRVEAIYKSMIAKGGPIAELTPEQAKREIMMVLAQREPELYEAHRAAINAYS